MNRRPGLFQNRLPLAAAGLLLLPLLGSFIISSRKDPNPPIKACVISIMDSVPFIRQVPSDLGGRYIHGANNQIDLNSFAWWEFVSLNWCDAENGFFGQPYDTLNPVQWETFITKGQLFPPGGAAPPSWNSLATARQSILLNGRSVLTHLNVLRSDSKFSDEFLSRADSTVIDSSDGGEAGPRNAPSWLGTQDSTNVWYEVRLNHDLYNYVVKNRFYNAANQLAYVKNGTRIDLPFGTVGTDTVGALELKAAWMEVKNSKDPKWKRYKLTKAIVQDLNTGRYRPVILALVGLHILHKTQSQQSWIWATFEQVDNVPDRAHPCNSCRYNFNNPACTASCPVNQAPSYYLAPGSPGPMPIQISREHALDYYATVVNTKVQNFISHAFPGSVWQYYQLVNVMWSPNSPNNQTRNTVPLDSGYLSQPGGVVANTTLESYVQDLTCYRCHEHATIAGSSIYAADFSFSLGAATTPGLEKKKTQRLKMILKNR